MPTEPTVLPCVFCGCGWWTFLDTGYGICISCTRERCCAKGPTRKTERGAILAWNKRRTLSPEAAP